MAQFDAQAAEENIVLRNEIDTIKMISEQIIAENKNIHKKFETLKAETNQDKWELQAKIDLLMNECQTQRAQGKEKLDNTTSVLKELKTDVRREIKVRDVLEKRMKHRITTLEDDMNKTAKENEQLAYQAT